MQHFAHLPQVGDRLALTPPFREHVGSYSVTVGYRVTEISLAASARVPGAVITVTGRRPDGAPLKTGTSIDGVDLDLGGKRLRADTLRSFVDLSVGENEIAVEVANGGAGTKRTYRATVVRLDADLENADERSQLFREALLKGSADGLSRAIAVGESGEVALRNEMVSSCDVLHGLSEGGRARSPGRLGQPRCSEVHVVAGFSGSSQPVKMSPMTAMLA